MWVISFDVVYVMCVQWFLLIRVSLEKLQVATSIKYTCNVSDTHCLLSYSVNILFNRSLICSLLWYSEKIEKTASFFFLRFVVVVNKRHRGKLLVLLTRCQGNTFFVQATFFSAQVFSYLKIENISVSINKNQYIYIERKTDSL